MLMNKLLKPLTQMECFSFLREKITIFTAIELKKHFKRIPIIGPFSKGKILVENDCSIQCCLFLS